MFVVSSQLANLSPELIGGLNSHWKCWEYKDGQSLPVPQERKCMVESEITGHLWKTPQKINSGVKIQYFDILTSIIYRLLKEYYKDTYEPRYIFDSTSLPKDNKKLPAHVLYILKHAQRGKLGGKRHVNDIACPALTPAIVWHLFEIESGFDVVQKYGIEKNAQGYCTRFTRGFAQLLHDALATVGSHSFPKFGPYGIVDRYVVRVVANSLCMRPSEINKVFDDEPIHFKPEKYVSIVSWSHLHDTSTVNCNFADYKEKCGHYPTPGFFKVMRTLRDYRKFNRDTTRSERREIHRYLKELSEKGDNFFGNFNHHNGNDKRLHHIFEHGDIPEGMARILAKALPDVGMRHFDERHISLYYAVAEKMDLDLNDVCPDYLHA